MSRLTPRWLRNISCILLTAPAVVFTGCSTPGPGVVQISPDTYVVRMQNRNGIFVTDEPNLKAQAVGQYKSNAVHQHQPCFRKRGVIRDDPVFGIKRMK